MSPFVPLRLHSEYSIEDGIVRLRDAVNFGREQGFAAMALTDAMNMFGAVKFYLQCREAGMVPIFGVDVEMMPVREGAETSRLLLLAKDHGGYLKLCSWLTDVYVNEKRQERACLPRSFLEGDTSGLICLSGAVNGTIGQSIAAGRAEEAEEEARRLAACFPDAFYLELQRLPDYPHESFSERENAAFARLRNKSEEVLRGSLKIAEALDLPAVATHPVQFMVADDFRAHEVRVCIAEKTVLADEHRALRFHPSQWFLSGDEMVELFADLPEAIENTMEIAKRCSAEVVLGKHFLPEFPVPEGMSLGELLCRKAREGLDERLQELFPDPAERDFRQPEYRRRLERELDIIIRMDFPGYFLIVADFINWAKTHDCPVGPGRGSGAGSLVAYCLKITELDPLRYALLFERFLNPERVSMPDFDVDFCQQNRDRVIDYVRRRYGEDAVGQIVTFGTLSSKAAVRDVGRVLSFPYGFCDKLSKLIPKEANKPVSLAEALEKEPAIAAMLDKENARELMNLAMKLEDLTRGTGTHAGGVVIAKGKLADYCPVYRAPSGDIGTVSMYDKDDVEKAGLVKFDFLGLLNLTSIRMAEEMIEKVRGEKVDVAHIPLDDAAVYEKIFAAGNTTAVFQFESPGMKGYLKEAKPTKFEDLIAFNALYRPGPMDLIPDFIKRMKGESFKYLHESLREILEPTYGIMVYQEQVMQTAQVCAGYSLGGADLLRRAMGKKKIGEMVKHRATFVAGAAKNGIDQTRANEIFDYMEKFAGYGFNKSHSAAYALVAYQTAWLKLHYTAEFFAAVMSGEFDNSDHLKLFYDDAVANGIRFLPPSVNHSFYRFEALNAHEIRYALGAIKGTGEGAIEAIVRERETNGPFRDLFDFCLRADKKAVNRRVLEALIRAGAFDEIHPDRAQLEANIDLATKYAEQTEDNCRQCGLFDEIEESRVDVGMRDVPSWSLSERLNKEKEVMGFYFSEHPCKPYEQDIRKLARVPLNQLQASEGRQWIGGFVTSVRSIITQKKGKLWIILLEDTTGSLEITASRDVVQAFGELRPDRPLLFECRLRPDNRDRSRLRIDAERIVSLDAMLVGRARSLNLELREGDDIERLFALLEKHRLADKRIPVIIDYRNRHARGRLSTDKAYTVTPSRELLDEVAALIGRERVCLSV